MTEREEAMARLNATFASLRRTVNRSLGDRLEGATMKATDLSIAREVYPDIPDDKYGDDFLYGMIVNYTTFTAAMGIDDDGPDLREQLFAHRQTTLGAVQEFNHLMRHQGRAIWNALRKPL